MNTYFFTCFESWKINLFYMFHCLGCFTGGYTFFFWFEILLLRSVEGEKIRRIIFFYLLSFDVFGFSRMRWWFLKINLSTLRNYLISSNWDLLARWSGNENWIMDLFRFSFVGSWKFEAYEDKGCVLLLAPSSLTLMNCGGISDEVCEACIVKINSYWWFGSCGITWY